MAKKQKKHPGKKIVHKSHDTHHAKIVSETSISKTSHKKSYKPFHKIHKIDSKSSKHKPVKHSIIHRFSSKFCPKCGNAITDDNILCKDCRTTDFEFKNLRLFVCNNCRSYNIKNKWQKFYDLNIVIKKIVDENVKKHKVIYVKLGDEKIEELLSYKAGVHKDFTVTVSLGKERFDLPAVIDVTLCPKCSKQGTKYFEGILQVRNAGPEIISFIMNDLSKNKSKGIHINKEVYIDDSGRNIDYYYTHKGYMRIIAEKLKNNFGAVLKQNAQLFSIDWETSKNQYRLNILVELPRYHKNDVIKSEEHLFKIVSMDEKIHVVDLKNNSKTLLSHKGTYDVLTPVEVMLIKKYPEYEVLDPNTYYQARLMNPSETLQINQKIHVVIDGGEAWIVKE